MNAVDSPPRARDWAVHAQQFVERIARECCGTYDPVSKALIKAPDKGARAALEDGLRKPVDAFGQAAHKCVLAAATRVGPQGARDAWLDGTLGEARERAYYAVAAMIAAQSRDARDQSALGGAGSAMGSLGTSAAQLDAGEPLERETPREAELRALAHQSLDGIHRRLPDLVRQLRYKQIGVDWAALISDLSRWQYAREEVTKSWNQDYYRARYKVRPSEQDPAGRASDLDESEAS